ncbi:SsgA family sporulation/cell division regulator [Streptomyces sp. MUM 136J]|uniref:SsgA family sporulation/cell division regulator n=1 Tax=Streptomyces sp. MUM 136J TaxID=2791992 RepID=UPI001F0439A9|nr:SsgA family sporulation/cell division regulator [Streptomyces sp. MUM 136J]MCH0572398.1 SsgA family sporulation/cell division regulator [Streptomyces sp. MUM 136J]
MEHLVDAEILMDFLAGDDLEYPIPVRMLYHGCDPLAVRLTFALPGDTPVTWYVARELLLEGLLRPAGEGDVRILPAQSRHPDAVLIHVRVCEEEALFRTSVPPLLAFLDRTGMVVPVGREDLHPCFQEHLDDELDAIIRTSL